MLSIGSTWRRWDLHVHTPDTSLNDQFGDWDEFLAAIEGQTEVSVLGVTDEGGVESQGRGAEGLQDRARTGTKYRACSLTGQIGEIATRS